MTPDEPFDDDPDPDKDNQPLIIAVMCLVSAVIGFSFGALFFCP